MTLPVSALGLEKTAVLSADGVYRYELTRRWGPEAFVVWVMLNPSTADADVDDPTIRRCMGFARAWGWGGIRVVNLFALRATNPKRLAEHLAPVGPENMDAIGGAIAADDTAVVVAAWGHHGRGLSIGQFVVSASGFHARPLHCLGRTKSGAPRHPLYVRGDQPLEVYA